MNSRERRREQIIEKASELFAARDFHTVQMDEIAEASNVAKGTLYNYFKSKEDLYVSTIHIRLQKLADLLANAYEKREDPWRNLRSFIVHYEGFMIKYPHFFRILRKCDALFTNGANGELQRIRLKVKTILEDVLTAGVSLGHFRDHQPELTADLVLGMIEARVMTQLDQGQNNGSAEAILKLLQGGLSKTDGKEPR